MTLETLRAQCAEWQERLRLRDWAVDVEVVEAWDMTSLGDCRFRIQDKRAKIRVKRPDHVEGSFPADRDWEITLVHELLHLHFAPLHVKAETAEDTAQEVAIDLIACALVNSYRQRK